MLVIPVTQVILDSSVILERGESVVPMDWPVLLAPMVELVARATLVTRVTKDSVV